MTANIKGWRNQIRSITIRNNAVDSAEVAALFDETIENTKRKLSAASVQVIAEAEAATEAAKLQKVSNVKQLCVQHRINNPV